MSEEAGVDQSDLAASPLPPYIPSHPPLSPPDIAGHQEDVRSQNAGGSGDGFKFDAKGQDVGMEKDGILLEDRCDAHEGIGRHNSTIVSFMATTSEYKSLSRKEKNDGSLLI